MTKSREKTLNLDDDAFLEFSELVEDLVVYADGLMAQIYEHDPDENNDYMDDWRDVVAGVAPSDRDFRKMIRKLRNAADILEEIGDMAFEVWGHVPEMLEESENDPENRPVIEERLDSSKDVDD